MALMMMPRARKKAGAGPRAEAQAWLLLLTSGRATEADAEDFQRWRRADPGNETAFAEQQGLWRALGPALREESAARARAPERRPAMGRRAFLGGAVAASAAYLALRPPLGLWPGIGELSADYRTARGEQRRLTLGDALDVQMNTLTRINVTIGADGAKLIELADGEAEVRAGAEPAQVVAGAGRILARDASFNLRYVDGEARLCCLSGTVRLTHAQGVFDLGAQRELRYDGRGVQPPAPVDTDRVVAWRQGWLVFDQQPLSQVVDELNRYRRGHLVLMNEQLGKRLVQARISLAQIADAEKLIRDAYGARLTHLPAGVVLLS